MSTKDLTAAALEVTQRIQLFFPRDLDTEILEYWGKARKEEIADRLRSAFGTIPRHVKDGLENVITIPASDETFVAREHFVVDVRPTARARIAAMDENFKKWYLGKVEEGEGEKTLRSRPIPNGRLLEQMSDCGPDHLIQVSLRSILYLVSLQPLGGIGFLKTGGRDGGDSYHAYYPNANYFFVPDIENEFHFVALEWRYDGGWLLTAFDSGPDSGVTVNDNLLIYGSNPTNETN